MVVNASGTEKSDVGRGTRSYISEFVNEKGINFPILLDTQGEVSALYNARSLPTTVVISPDGIVTQIKIGVVDSFWLRSAVILD